MRVLHVIPSVAPARGGPSQAVLQAVAALNAAGVSAGIVTTNDAAEAVLDVPLDATGDFGGAPVRFFPRWSPRVRALREFAYSHGLALWLARHVTDYELVHVHALFSHAATAAMRAARRAGVPFVVQPHGLLCDWSLRQSAWRKRAYLALLERANLEAGAAIVYTTEQERNEADALRLPPPAVVVPFGVDVPARRPDARVAIRRRFGLSSDEPIVLFLSRLHPKKGLERLLDALVAAHRRRFAVVVAGGGDAAYERALRARAQAGPLAARVHFTGFVDGEFKQQLLQGADLFALTSYSESLAIAVLEALAAGTPVLLSPEVPLAGLVERARCGWVAPSIGLAAAVSAALDAQSEPAGAEARAQRCRDVAAAFSWDAVARGLRDLYAALLERREPPSFEPSLPGHAL